jgi:hypothetical protein
MLNSQQKDDIENMVIQAFGDACHIAAHCDAVWISNGGNALTFPPEVVAFVEDLSVEYSVDVQFATDWIEDAIDLILSHWKINCKHERVTMFCVVAWYVATHREFVSIGQRVYDRLIKLADNRRY